MKKFLILVLSIMFLFTFSYAADKKTTKKEEPKKKEETKKTSTPVVQKTMPEPKNASYKEKFGIGIDVVNKAGLVRIWLANSLALEATAGLFFASGNPASFGIRLGGNAVFPIVDDQKFRLDVAPGLIIKYAKNDPNEILSSLTTLLSASGSGGSGDISILYLLCGVGLSFEVFLTAISNDLSIGSQIGLNLGIKNVNVGASSTSFVFQIAEDKGIIPIIIRYYL